jgi:hypothetical protein
MERNEFKKTQSKLKRTIELYHTTNINVGQWVTNDNEITAIELNY